MTGNNPTSLEIEFFARCTICLCVCASVFILIWCFGSFSFTFSISLALLWVPLLWLLLLWFTVVVACYCYLYCRFCSSIGYCIFSIRIFCAFCLRCFLQIIGLIFSHLFDKHTHKTTNEQLLCVYFVSSPILIRLDRVYSNTHSHTQTYIAYRNMMGPDTVGTRSPFRNLSSTIEIKTKGAHTVALFLWVYFVFFICRSRFQLHTYRHHNTHTKSKRRKKRRSIRQIDMVRQSGKVECLLYACA